MFDWSIVNQHLSRLKSVPEIMHNYDLIGEISSVTDFNAIPSLSEEKYIKAISFLSANQQLGIGSYVFCSSGSTGKPKIGIQPCHQNIREITAKWKPLARKPGLFVDFSGGGHAWSANHFFRELCFEHKYQYLHLGNITSFVEMDAGWGSFIKEFNVNVISGNPTQLAFIARYFQEHKIRIPAVKTVLWTGEPLKAYQQNIVEATFPNAQFWSVYGGTESWVIGYQSPDMPRNEFVTLDHQFVESCPSGFLVTSFARDCFNPVLRYQMNDIIRPIEVSSSKGIERFQIMGRSDKKLFFDGNNISTGNIISAIKEIPVIKDVQILIQKDDDNIKEMEIRVQSNGINTSSLEGLIRQAVVECDLQNIVLKEDLIVNLESPFVINKRNGKCADVVFLPP